MKKIYKVYECHAEVTTFWLRSQHITDESKWARMLFENTGNGESLFSEPEKAKFYKDIVEAKKDFLRREVARAHYNDYCQLWDVNGKMLEELEYDAAQYDDDVTPEEIECDVCADCLSCEYSPFPMCEEEVTK